MEKAKITGYRSPLCATAKIGTNEIVVRIPVNVIPPIPGSEVPVKIRAKGVVAAKFKTVEGKQVRDGNETVTEDIYVYEASAVGK